MLREQDDIVSSLVRPLDVVILNEFRNGSVQGSLAEEDHPVEAFIFNGSNESFSEGVQIRASRRQRQCFDADRTQDHVEASRKLGVPISDQISASGKQSAAAGGEIASGLPHPCISRVASDSRQVDLSAADMDEEEAVVGYQAESGPNFGGEEVGGEQAIRMGTDEVGPTCLALPMRRWVDAMFFEDVFDGLMADVVIQGDQGASDSAIAPGGILPRQLQDQIDNDDIGLRSSDGFRFPTGSPIELLGDQFSVPSKNRFGRDDTGDSFKRFTAELLADGRKRDSLAVSETGADWESDRAEFGSPQPGIRP
ncbi:MAG: hypothetical protein M3O30_11990 [Planctomycetota bacterium]|nr:hypothetical protein [Planctomycetota bacterium]